MTDVDLALRYHDGVSVAARSALAAEPEAQLTAPVKELFEAVGSGSGGQLQLVREAQLDGVRPDFGALFNGQPCGWIELKAPAKSIDGTKWRGREAAQWELLAQLDSLIVCNGSHAQLYNEGVPVSPLVVLPLQDASTWDAEPLRELLLLFTSARPSLITRVSDLARRLAPLARLLRDRILVLLDDPSEKSAMRQGMKAWAAHIHNDVDKKGFANDLAQVVAYSMAIAALRGGADVNANDLIELDEARHAIERTSPVLAAALGPVLGVKGLLAQIRHEVAAIERLVSAVDPVAVARSHDPRGEPWLWFYEDFLGAFDPEARKKAGVYYTPTDVVEHQVRMVDDIIQMRFGRRLGFADPSVLTLDPACGSGTYPLAIIDASVETALQLRGPAGPSQVASTLARNLISFELMPGPYAVAHLRIGQRLAEMAGQLIPPKIRVYLADTLDDPDAVAPTLPLWGDADVLAEERRRAQEVKRDEKVMVAIGNPPYDRVSAASGAGGWVVSSGRSRSLFDDVLEPATASTRFSHIASLYNLYVYFWRWAIWKVFEGAEDGPGVVSFITASSWLSGPGFVGLRQLAQSLADEIWVCDLGGDNRGTRVEENVFDIETPVAIVTLFRDGKSSRRELPRVFLRRLSGTRQEKLSGVAGLASPLRDQEAWEELTLAKLGDPMVQQTAGSTWQSMPSLAQIFPWQYPGLMINRTWPVAPSAKLLAKRWAAFVALPSAELRAEAYITPPTGRNIHTRVQGLPPLSSLQKGAPHLEIARYSFRSFDRQWILHDPRLIALDRPALWASRSERQIFLSTMMTTPLGRGPVMTVATEPPDKHHFRGSYGGKDTIPLFRDSSANQPNVTKGLPEALGSEFRAIDPRKSNPTPEDLAAYVYAILSSPRYFEMFSDELAAPGPRVPIVRTPDLFARVCELGRELLWLHTFGQRYTGRTRPADIVRDPNVFWEAPVTAIPETMASVKHEPGEERLVVGNGSLRGVSEWVWSHSVSGWPILQRWLAYRTVRGYGRAASRPGMLDAIRPIDWEDEWNDELLELVTVLRKTEALLAQQAALVDEVCAADLVPASDLPIPEEYECKEPKVS
ncbi:type ISP restriction/modification enzyme [Micromonospora chalcea]